LHIPLYVPGGPNQNITLTPRVGDPAWGEKIDPFSVIEKRPIWPKEATPQTLATVALALENCAPQGPILAILAGHEHIVYANPIGAWRGVQAAPSIVGSHRWGRHNGAMQFSTLDGLRGGSRLVEISIYRRKSEWCLERGDRVWKYQICIGRSIWQTATEEMYPSFCLGHYDPASDTRLPNGTLTAMYVNGTDGRKAELLVHCGNPGFDISERSPNYFHIEAWTKLVCEGASSSWKHAWAQNAVFDNPLALGSALIVLLVILRRFTCRPCEDSKQHVV